MKTWDVAKLAVLLCLPLIGHGSGDDDCSDTKPLITWNYYQYNHKSLEVSTGQLQTLSALSDTQYFKDVLLKPILKVREVGTQAHTDVRTHIETTLQNLGWNIEEDTFQDTTPLGIKTFTNVIATYDTSKTRKLVLACHYDSKYFDDIEFIGATDSAVPCAMLLDLATNLKDLLNKNPSQVGLQFIFFDGEEAFVQWTSTDSIYGARHLAAKMDNEKVQVQEGLTISALKTIDAFVLLDLIGAPNPTFRNFFSETNKLWQRLQGVEKRLAREQLLLPTNNFSPSRNTYFVDSFSGLVEDDHIPFLRKKVPILHLICYPFPSVWHTASDNEAALDYTAIDNLNKVFRIFVAEYLWLRKGIPEL